MSSSVLLHIDWAFRYKISTPGSLSVGKTGWILGLLSVAGSMGILSGCGGEKVVGTRPGGAECAVGLSAGTRAGEAERVV